MTSVSLLIVVISDCPRNIRIEPPNVCQAGTVLTCIADSYPPATYEWWDLYSWPNERVSTSQTYTLPTGRYRLMCIATSNASCSQQPNSTCRERGSLSQHDDFVSDPNFPYSQFNSTAANFVGTIVRENCTANTTIYGFAVCKY